MVSQATPSFVTHYVLSFPSGLAHFSSSWDGCKTSAEVTNTIHHPTVPPLPPPAVIPLTRVSFGRSKGIQQNKMEQNRIRTELEHNRSGWRCVWVELFDHKFHPYLDKYKITEAPRNNLQSCMKIAISIKSLRPISWNWSVKRCCKLPRLWSSKWTISTLTQLFTNNSYSKRCGYYTWGAAKRFTNWTVRLVYNC